MHVFIDYNDIKTFWEGFIKEGIRYIFFSLGTHEWLKWNLSNDNVGTVHLFFGLVALWLSGMIETSWFFSLSSLYYMNKSIN